MCVWLRLRYVRKNKKNKKNKKNIGTFLLLENCRSLSPPPEPQTPLSSSGTLDFLSICLGIDSLTTFYAHVICLVVLPSAIDATKICHSEESSSSLLLSLSSLCGSYCLLKVSLIYRVGSLNFKLKPAGGPGFTFWTELWVPSKSIRMFPRH